MKSFVPLVVLLYSTIGAAEPLFLECSISGKSFDNKFQETISIKIDNGMIDIDSEEFPMFSKVNVTEKSYKSEQGFVSDKGVKYFFNIELDRVSGRFISYETAAFPDRKVYNTTGSGPCSKVSAFNYENRKTKPESKPTVRAIIRSP
jgi:hypothetical protein